MAEKITWTNERRTLADLKPWERNPRQISRDQAKRLTESFDQFGQVETIAVGPENQVYNGHQRLSVLMDKHGGGYEVEVRVASRALTEKEREKLTVFLHRGSTGEWNFDTLSEWDVPDLVEWGFAPEELGIVLDAEETEKAEAETIPEQYMILIECVDEQTQAELLDRFNVEGLKCRALIS
ncbi:MAG: ParB N-terminal domain-containing protein [Bellilinea sp.]